MALADAGLLAEFCTTVGWNPPPWLENLLPPGLKRTLSRRALPEALKPVAKYFPFKEAARHACSRAGLRALTRHETGPFCIDAIYRALDREVSRRIGNHGTLSGIYAYEDGALSSFRVARQEGLHRFYDLPIGHWRAWQRIQEEEAQREPQWAASLRRVRDSAEKLARKDAEISLADDIFVASTYTRSTLDEAPNLRGEIHVIPYGAPPPSANRKRRFRDKLRLLFVGALSQRKGISYLFRALNLLGDAAELTLIGAMPPHPCPPLDAELQKHRWIPSLPHSQILEEMRSHDIFVFPSLFEGFGLVILEAMSQGLPVITTSHTAGPDIIDDSVDGFIVPIRSPESIAGRIESLLLDPSRIEPMSRAAIAKAASFAWSTYRSRLAAIVERKITSPPKTCAC